MSLVNQILTDSLAAVKIIGGYGENTGAYQFRIETVDKHHGNAPATELPVQLQIGIGKSSLGAFSNDAGDGLVLKILENVPLLRSAVVAGGNLNTVVILHSDLTDTP